MKLVNIYLLNSKSIAIILVMALLLVSATLSAQTWSLTQCVDTALLHNRNILLSNQDMLTATEKKREVKAGLLPKLNGMADYRYYTDLPFQLMPAAVFGGPEGTYKEVQFGVAQNMNASLQLTLPLYNPNIISAMASTRVASELAEIQQLRTEEEVVLEVSGAYYNAQILISQIGFLDNNIINTRQLVKTTELMYQQLLVKRTDVDRLQLQLEQAILRRSFVVLQQQQVLNALKFMMGKSLADSLRVLPVENTAIESDFQPRPTADILLIDKRLELGYSELRSFKNSRLPSLGAYGVYGTNGFGNTGSNSFFNFHPVGYVGAQLTVPLFNGTVTRHRIVQKKIELEKTIIQQELVTEKNKLDQINAGMQYEQANRNLVTSKLQIDLASGIFDNTVLQNEQGLANITDLLLADNALREAQQNYIETLINLRKAELEFKRVTGNLITTKN